MEKKNKEEDDLKDNSFKLQDEINSLKNQISVINITLEGEKNAVKDKETKIQT
jgi:hypothetical protein